MGGGGIHHAVQDLLGEGHGGGTDGQHALAGLKICQRLDGLLGAVAEILAHGPVEVDIHKARQGVKALGVEYLFALLRGAEGDDAALPDEDASLFKGVAGRINESIFYQHFTCLLNLSVCFADTSPNRRGKKAASWLPY